MAEYSDLASSFIQELVRQWRAQDSNGAWDKKSDEELLSSYIVTREQRRSMPIIGNPDAKTLWRIELFYNALGMALERHTGVIASPMIKLHQEGFGRIVLLAGHLVLLNQYVRDVHRYGFENMNKLAAEGEKLLATSIDMVKAFPEVVNYNS